MLDGLWLVQFHSPLKNDTRSGVVVFQGAALAGGDSAYYYTGAYSVSDEHVLMNLRIRKHSPGISVFGHLTDFKVILGGKISGHTMLFEGVLEHREQHLQVKFSKLF